MAKTPYCEAIGSLIYAAIATWPDIAFAVSTLSQFLENPGITHWEAVKRIFRYLIATQNFILTYGSERYDLTGYTDVDGANQEHRHAISGSVFLIDGLYTAIIKLRSPLQLQTITMPTLNISTSNTTLFEMS
jgi:hypothetical protein